MTSAEFHIFGLLCLFRSPGTYQKSQPATENELCVAIYSSRLRL
jgi:hypothetical protein